MASEPDDVVLDPFCGCRTAVVAAEALKRRWIGIDITSLAVVLMKNRLTVAFPYQPPSYKVVGEPESFEDAVQLASEDRYQFQWWALGLVKARPAEQKKGADKGVDGRLYFHDEGTAGSTKQVILSVKSGHVSVRDIRELTQVVNREGAQLGVLITLEEPTQPMRTEAAGEGFYTSPVSGEQYPRIQILTVKALLAGGGVQYPVRMGANVSLKHRAVPAGPDAPPAEDALF